MVNSGLTNAISTGLAALAVLLGAALALTAVLALCSTFSERARRILADVRETVLGGELWAAWIVALVATLGSLYFSEVANFVPCKLCWLQRIAMYPLVLILLVGALRGDVRAGVQYAFVFPIVGILIAAYHVYIEINPGAETASCRVGGASCATKWIDKFGFVTIPVLAMVAFGTILTLLALAWSRRRGSAPT
ncbi:MAG: disulfide oxidoreductase [Solirubrobacteraceae bacterium]